MDHMANTVVECSRCKEVYPQEKIFTVCPKCEGALLIRYDLKAIKKNVSRDNIEKRHQTFWQKSTESGQTKRGGKLRTL